MRRLVSPLVTLLLAIALGLGLTACDGGGSVAPASSRHASPGSSGPSSATLVEGAWTDFSGDVSVSDLEIPGTPGLVGRALVVEDGGVLRSLDLAGGQPAGLGELELVAGGLPSGVATGDLTVVDDRTALVTTSGDALEAIHVLDPLSATGPGDVTTVDVPDSVDIGGQAPDSLGQPAGPDVETSFTAAATLTSGRLFCVTSNLDLQTQAYRPGTLIAWDWDASAARPAGGPQAVATSGWNPVDVHPVETSGGSELLLVLQAGPWGGDEGAIDVVDPATLQVLETYPLGGNPAGEIAVSPDGERAFCGSSSASALHLVDLTVLEDLVAGRPVDMDAAVLHGGDDPVDLPGRHGAPDAYVPEVRVSEDGSEVYAIQLNDSTLTVLDRQGDTLTVREQVGFERQADPTRFSNNASLLAVRPGEPGVDYRGPELWVTTINLAAADRVDPDVEVTLDAVDLP